MGVVPGWERSNPIRGERYTVGWNDPGCSSSRGRRVRWVILLKLSRGRKAFRPVEESHLVSTREEMEGTAPLAWRISSTMREGPHMIFGSGEVRERVRRRIPPRMSSCNEEEAIVRSSPLREPPL